MASIEKAQRRNYVEAIVWITIGIVISRFAFVSLPPWQGVAIGLAFGALAIVGALGKLRWLRVRKWRTVGLVWLTAVIAIPSAQDFGSRSELAHLKSTAPQLYLKRLEELGHDSWLAELQRLDPDAYRLEADRRRAAKAHEQAQREAAKAEVDRQARDAAIQQMVERDYGNFTVRLQQASADIATLRYEGPTTLSEVDGILHRIDAFAEIVAEAEEFDLTDEQRSQRQELKSKLAGWQSIALPQLRRAFAALASTELWRDDGQASTAGAGDRTIELTAPKYILNANIGDDYNKWRRTLLKLRFTKARFRSSSEDDQASYDLNTAPADDRVIYWEDTIPNEVQ